MNSTHEWANQRLTRIAVLNSHPIQYFAPLYAYLNAAPDLEVTALYLSDISVRGGKDEGFGRDIKWDVDLLSGYPALFIGSRTRTRNPEGFWSLVAPQIWSEVRSGRYDVLWLHGHNYAANLLALAAARVSGIPVMMRGETHLGLARFGLKGILRRPLLQILYSQCDRLLAIGTANKAFYQAMGVVEDKIFCVPYSVDNARFIKLSSLTSDKRREVRKQYDLPLDRPCILYAAKFSRRKRPLDLLNAARRLQTQTRYPFTIVMVGSGDLEADLRSFCIEHGLNNVVFPGFVNQSALPALYGACDVFVLPSEGEPWGLAVNEAMCAGLPIVVSREVGCVADLVSDGLNGYTPPCGDIDALALSLKTLIESEDLRKQQGRESLRRIQEWGYRQCLDGIRVAIAGLKAPRVGVDVLVDQKKV
jgi:glycosyltransferase involved in cell wall biosynthesis